MQVSVRSVLSVLFFPPRDIANKAAFVSNFQDYAKVFDADPMILPIGNAPPQVPRITMKSRDGRYACEVALDRLSFAYNDATDEKPTLEALYPKYRDILNHVVLATLSGVGSPIVRLGFVTRHLLEIGGGANEWLRDTYLRADRLPEAFETHVNLLHRISMESFQVNRWLKIFSVREQREPQTDSGVAVEIDVNTIPEPERQYDRSAILSFFLDAFALSEKDLKAYVLDLLDAEMK